jgi:carbonic anhydrase
MSGLGLHVHPSLGMRGASGLAALAGGRRRRDPPSASPTPAAAASCGEEKRQLKLPPATRWSSAARAGDEPEAATLVGAIYADGGRCCGLGSWCAKTHLTAPDILGGTNPKGAEMSAIDEFLKNNEAFAEGFDKGDLPLPPAKKVAIVACMDARLNPYPILGLSIGDAHVIRNAGGVITDDEIRSLAISQHLLGTEEIMLIHHTDCGMLTFSDTEFEQTLEKETGQRPEWRPRSFPDLEDDLRDSIKRIKENPFIPRTDEVRGFVYDVKTGRLSEVT